MVVIWPTRRYAPRVLIAIEGIDGAGKRTLTEGLRKAFETDGKSVAELAFPRYGRSVHADLVAEALHGRHGDLLDSVYAMAVLFALDRAEASKDIARLVKDHDVLIIDRYVASNAAYAAGRLHEQVVGEVVRWVQILEYERFRLPRPDWQVLLDVPTKLAAQRAMERAQKDIGRSRDAYEVDSELQARVGATYTTLAATNWCGRWKVVDADIDVSALAVCLGAYKAEGSE